MQRFSRLYRTLDETTSTNAKVAAMVRYFDSANARDAAWAVYFLSGRRIKRLLGGSLLRSWLTELCDLPQWLVEESYASVGDLAETIALLLAEPSASEDSRSLADWVEQQILALKDLPLEEQRAIVTNWWLSLPYEHCYIVTKLLTGALRVGVSQTLVARALAEHTGLPRAVILHRLMGEWAPNADFYRALTAEDDGETLNSRPYPFCLASPLEAPVKTLGPCETWLAEWKWDGIRTQLVRRRGETYLWSRGEELIGTRFPEIVEAAQSLPDGIVLDGEILPWNADGVMGFAALQRRIGRKSVGRKLLAEVPCIFLAYDVLELDGSDVREHPLERRRETLEALIAGRHPSLMLSECLPASEWDTLAALRADSRQRLVEGLMLKDRSSSYATGRKRGLWWKWKIEPYTVDAVMIYAQAGHGRRANLFTDYTFAVWDDDRLVPFAKAYSGLDDTEIARLDKWIRRNTLERFGPVRAVKCEQVFELAFEGINMSSRHKSGVAVRFPRIVRWREDLAPADADTLDDVKRLIARPGNRSTMPASES